MSPRGRRCHRGACHSLWRKWKSGVNSDGTVTNAGGRAHHPGQRTQGPRHAPGPQDGPKETRLGPSPGGRGLLASPVPADASLPASEPVLRSSVLRPSSLCCAPALPGASGGLWSQTRRQTRHVTPRGAPSPGYRGLSGRCPPDFPPAGAAAPPGSSYCAGGGCPLAPRFLQLKILQMPKGRVLG